MSLVSTLSNGIKVATLNNGVKAVQVGLFSAKGSGMESMESVGQMNLLANCVNLNANPMVNASVSRNATVVRSVGKNGLNRISAALNNSVNEATFNAAKEVSHAQAVNLDNDWKALTENYAFRTGFMNQALGELYMGPTNNIEEATVGDISNASRRLNEAGLVIAAVGDVDHDAFVKDAEAQFGHLAAATGDKYDTPAHFIGSSYEHRFDCTNFGLMSVLHHVPPPRHSAALNFEIAAQLVGSYDPKRHGNAHSAAPLRRRMGRRPGPGGPKSAGVSDLNAGLDCEYLKCAYNVVAGNAVLQWTTKTLGQAAPGKGIHDECNLRVLLYLGNMYRRVSEFEITRGKNQFMMSLANSLQQDPLAHVGNSMLDYGFVRTVSNMKQKINLVNVASMKDAFQTYIVDQDPAAGKTGCTEKLLHNSELKTHTNPKTSVF